MRWLSRSVCGGLTWELYHGNLSQVFVKLRASQDLLKTEAARIDYKLLLDRRMAKRRAEDGKKDSRGKVLWAPINIVDVLGICKYWPYEYIYGKYSTDPNLQDLYALQQNQSIFRAVDRIKLITSRIKGSRQDGGAGLSIGQLIRHKAILVGTYPHQRCGNAL